MTKAEMDSKVKELRELKHLIDDAQALVDSLQDEIKAEMTVQGVDTLSGSDWKVTWKQVTKNSLDTTALKKALPELAAKFNKVSTYKTFKLS